MVVNLNTIADAFEMINDVDVIYYDLDKNEVGLISHIDSIKLDTEIEDLVPENGVLLPYQFDINEYSIMKNFIFSLEDNDMKEEFIFAINGRGAFRNFKHLIHRHSIQERWYSFKRNAYILIAKEWCIENGIEYED